MRKYLDWLNGLRTNLVSVRGAQGSLMAESLDDLGTPHNLLEAEAHVEQVRGMLDERRFKRRWVEKIQRKADVWTQVIKSSVSKEGIGSDELQEMLLSGGIDVSTYLDSIGV